MKLITVNEEKNGNIVHKTFPLIYSAYHTFNKNLGVKN